MKVASTVAWIASIARLRSLGDIKWALGMWARIVATATHRLPPRWKRRIR